jgi:tRNA(Met) C34 N-acetyltransferase TmcA
VDTLRDSQPAGPLVGLCRTIDQARAVVTFLDSASEKTLRSTVALTASRGRGKSAALGMLRFCSHPSSIPSCDCESSSVSAAAVSAFLTEHREHAYARTYAVCSSDQQHPSPQSSLSLE